MINDTSQFLSPVRSENAIPMALSVPIIVTLLETPVSDITTTGIYLGTVSFDIPVYPKTKPNELLFHTKGSEIATDFFKKWVGPKTQLPRQFLPIVGANTITKMNIPQKVNRNISKIGPMLEQGGLVYRATPLDLHYAFMRFAEIQSLQSLPEMTTEKRTFLDRTYLYNIITKPVLFIDNTRLIQLIFQYYELSNPERMAFNETMSHYGIPDPNASTNEKTLANFLMALQRFVRGQFRPEDKQIMFSFLVHSLRIEVPDEAHPNILNYLPFWTEKRLF